MGYNWMSGSPRSGKLTTINECAASAHSEHIHLVSHNGWKYNANGTTCGPKLNAGFKKNSHALVSDEDHRQALRKRPSSSGRLLQRFQVLSSRVPVNSSS